MPAGADLAGVLRKRFRLQRECQSADGRASGCRDGVREGRKGRGIEGRHVRRTDVCKRGKKGGRYGEEAEEAADRGIARV